MTFDIAIDGETEDAHLDDTNDLATVDGNDRVEQHVYLNVGDRLNQLLSGSLTGQTLTQAEAAVEDGLNDASDVGTIRGVSIEKYDKDASTVIVSATAESGNVVTFGVTV